MPHRSSPARLLVVAFALVGLGVAVPAQTPAPKVTSPQQFFGHEIGADYVLPNYTKLSEYWQQLDRESDRMVVQSIGKTAEGRDQLMAILTAPENFKALDRYRDISRRLALAEGLTDEQARALAAEGKAVVWIDGGLHATEVLGAQQLLELVYQLASRTDPETVRILRDVIVLAVHANPDGMELVSNWYMREPKETLRSTSDIPRLYQKYAGHDNNRDFYMSAQPETTNMNRVMYQWYPQIMYNHHQTGPTGTVLFAPPFREPHNFNFDPLIVTGLDVVGAAMHNRFVAENKPGATMRRGANYSTWFNGGLRTTAYFHNIIGILTESIGNPTPVTIPFVPQRQIKSADLPFPIAPQQVWHFRQSIEYSMTANRAILDLASRYREQFLFNVYQMGRNSIQRGSEDSWTVWPNRMDAVQAAIAKDRQGTGGPVNTATVTGGFAAPADAKYYAMLRDQANRDPRGYIVPSSQPDFPTATKFVNTLIKLGVTVHRATAAFTVAGKTYPAGSFVVKAAQVYRPHVLDMFEPQYHPNDVQFPGGPPIPPYDNAGYTLAYQMGVEFDRVLDAFDGPFEKLPDLVAPAPGTITGASGAAGFLLSHRMNDAFIAVNRLLKAGEDVYWLEEGPNGMGPGTMFVAARPSTLPILQRAASELGLGFTGVATRPAGPAVKLSPMRIGLWDRYGGSIASGWLRWIFEQYEFPYELVYPQQVDAGNLASKYDVLVFVNDAIPETDDNRRSSEPAPESVPAEFRGSLGRLTVAKSVPALRAFVEAGGTLVAVGSSTVIGSHFGLPIADGLVERTAAGERKLGREKFYVPGSVLRAKVDNSQPLAWGMPGEVDVFFDSSPSLALGPDAGNHGVRAVAWYDTATPLRSGWAWGQHYLKDTVAAVSAPLGKGQVFLLAPEVTNRAQPHGTFKLLFNGLYLGKASPVKASPSTGQ